MHAHNEKNFPQAKLDSEINVPFLLNEHGDLYFLWHNNSVHIILFINKILSPGQKKTLVKTCKKPYSGMQIMTAKIATIRTLYSTSL